MSLSFQSVDAPIQSASAHDSFISIKHRLLPIEFILSSRPAVQLPVERRIAHVKKKKKAKLDALRTSPPEGRLCFRSCALLTDPTCKRIITTHRGSHHHDACHLSWQRLSRANFLEVAPPRLISNVRSVCAALTAQLGGCHGLARITGV